MTLEEFDQHLLLYGADLTHWPEALMPDAYALLQRNPQAQVLLNEVMQLDSGFALATQLTHPGAAATRLQAKLKERIDSNANWLDKVFTPKGFFALGSAGGLGGSALALVLPVGGDLSAVLAVALGGLMF